MGSLARSAPIDVNSDQRTKRRPAPRIGERHPDFFLPGSATAPVSFYEQQCGRPTALIWARTAAELAPFSELGNKAGVIVFLPPQSHDRDIPPEFTIIDDGALALALALGEEYPAPDSPPVIRVLDETLRFVARIPNADVAAVRCALARHKLAPALDEPLSRTAPVLLVPTVLEGNLCADLIEAHDRDNAPHSPTPSRDSKAGKL